MDDKQARALVEQMEQLRVAVEKLTEQINLLGNNIYGVKQLLEQHTPGLKPR